MSKFSVLFICTANICRTPMAEAYARKLVISENLSDKIEVLSAGTWAIQGVPPSENSQQVCIENNLDTSTFRSKPVNPTLLNNSSLVLCMTTEHKDDLITIFPHCEDKIFTVKEFCNDIPPQNMSIKDPHGRSLEIHRATFKEIQTEIDRMWPTLKARAVNAAS